MLDRFEEELGQSIGRCPIGYLFILTSDDSVAHFRKIVEMQRRLGVNTEWLTVEEIAYRVPLLNLDGVLAGSHYADDGLADPNSVVQGYTSGARRLGVELVADVEVTGIQVEGGEIQKVLTEKGDVSTPIIVDAAGPWAGAVGSWAGLYEVSPDAHPVLGRVPQVEGLYCISSSSGHGFMHGPIGGRLLAEEIVDGAAHTLDISSLYIDRFENGAGLAEYNVV
jgi:sarcosine oxidase subunit beta